VAVETGGSTVISGADDAVEELRAEFRYKESCRVCFHFH